MSLYRTFKTDPELERDGIILEYGENSAGKTIAIRIARAGGGNTRFAKQMELKAKPFRRQIQTETIERETLQRILREVYADAVVLGWENVEDKDGNPMPFTKENVIQLFTDLPDLFEDVMEQAQKSALFRESVREEDAKN